MLVQLSSVQLRRCVRALTRHNTLLTAIKRAYFMTTLNDGVFSWDVRVINRRKTRFNRHVWLAWDYGQLHLPIHYIEKIGEPSKTWYPLKNPRMRSTLWSTGSQVNSALLYVNFSSSSLKFCGRSSGSEHKQTKQLTQ